MKVWITKYAPTKGFYEGERKEWCMTYEESVRHFRNLRI